MLTVALAATGVGVSGAQASPARYIYEQCDSVLPNGGTSGVSALGGTYSYAVKNTCADSGGALMIWQTGVFGTQFANWTVPTGVPPGGRTETITVSATACNQGNPDVVAYAFRPDWSDNCSEEVKTYKDESSLALGFLVVLECKRGTITCGGPGPSIAAHYFATTEVDPVAPSVSDLAGSLIAGGVVRGHQTLSGIGHDVGGGVANVSVQVNGLPAAASKVSNCQTVRANNSSVVGIVASVPSPCPTSASASWILDTSAYPFHNGTNSVAVCASDFATLGDSNTTCSAAQSVDVDNSCTESAVPGGEALGVQFAASRREETTVPFGHSARITGELSNNAGDAVAGATICIQAQTLDNRRGLVPLATVTTDAHGHFSYKVPAGPNRRILVGYRHDTFQIARSVRYYSRAEPTLKATPDELENGKRVHLRGRVPGPGAGGRVVILQAGAVGSKRWITFRKATSARTGTFRASYHFTSTTRTTDYRFRAVVPNQTGYPWVEGASKPVEVTVTR
jgi:hypothetical protein